MHGFSKFASKMDDFRVYNRTLSSYEVSVLYGNGDGDFGYILIVIFLHPLIMSR